MRNLRYITIPIVLCAFFFMAVVCCCIEKVSAQEDVPPCHKHAQKADASKSETKDCCKKDLKLSLPEAKLQLSYLSVSTLYHLFVTDFTSYLPLATYHLSLLLGPPGPHSEVPLYLSHHNFRL